MPRKNLFRTVFNEKTMATLKKCDNNTSFYYLLLLTHGQDWYVYGTISVLIACAGFAYESALRQQTVTGHKSIDFPSRRELRVVRVS